MSRESDEEARSPFAHAPSARPPSADELLVQVRVPPPSRTTESLELASDAAPAPPAEEAPNEPAHEVVAAIPEPATASPRAAPPMTAQPLPPASSSPHHDHGQENGPPWARATDVSLQHAPAILGPAAMPAAGEAPPRRVRALLGAGIAAGAVLTVVITMIGARLIGGHGTPSADPSSTSTSASAGTVSSSDARPTPPLPTTSAPVAASGNPSPASPASAAPRAAGKRTPVKKPFDAKNAQTALDALVPKLAACKLTKGSSWSVKVTFAPDGRVTSVGPTGRHAAAQGACVAAQLKKARIAPFAGGPRPYMFTFVAGSK